MHADVAALFAEQESIEDLTDLRPWEGSQPAQFYLKARRERIRSNLTKPPKEAVHGLLRVQPAVELPRTIDEIMGRAPKSKRAGRLKPASATPVGGKDA
jgi:hypothetical protein